MLAVWIFGVLSAASLASILMKRPWTTRLARRHTSPEVWSTELFLETNVIITGAWATLFALAAVLAAVAPFWVNVAYGVVLFGLGRRSPKFGTWYSSRRLRAMGFAS